MVMDLLIWQLMLFRTNTFSGQTPFNVFFNLGNGYQFEYIRKYLSTIENIIAIPIWNFTGNELQNDIAVCDGENMVPILLPVNYNST
jgi:hypothetical protein